MDFVSCKEVPATCFTRPFQRHRGRSGRARERTTLLENYEMAENSADLGRMGFLLTESGAQECRGSASHALAASENSLTNPIAIDHEVLGILAHGNLLRVSPGLDVDHPSASRAAFRCVHRSLDGRVLA